MPENEAWGGFLGRSGRGYHQTVFQQWAIFYYQKAIGIGEAIHAENPGNIVIANGLATTYGNLGLLLYSKGDYAGAEQLYQKALEVSEKIFGAGHPNTLTTLTNLAWCLRNKGNHRDAIPLYSRILKIYENLVSQGVAIPPEHLSVMAICHNEIAFHRDAPAKSWKESEAHYRKAVEFSARGPSTGGSGQCRTQPPDPVPPLRAKGGYDPDQGADPHPRRGR